VLHHPDELDAAIALHDRGLRLRGVDPRVVERAMRRRSLGGRGRRSGSGGGGGGPTNTSAPVLGEAYAGASPAITAGTWSGSPTLTYSLKVNGVEVVAGDEATVEAYVYVLGDEGYDAILYEIPDGTTGSQVASDTVAVDLMTKIIEVATAASIASLGLFPVRRSDLDLTLLSGKVADWANWGTGSDATQATDSARLTYSATANNGKPGVLADGGDYAVTGAIDPGAATAEALMAFFSDSDTAPRCPAAIGDITTTALILFVNAGAAGDLDVYADGFVGAGSLASRARSAAGTYPMTTPGVVTGTFDAALSTNETEIRHNGSNVTSSRPNNSDNTTGIGSQDIHIGARHAGSNLTGAISFVGRFAHSGAWSGDALTALATIESLVATAWGP
jgi:hypothetical protein